MWVLSRRGDYVGHPISYFLAIKQTDILSISQGAYISESTLICIRRPTLLFITVFLALFMAMTESLANAKRTQEAYWRYSTVTGYFLQDEDSTDAKKFDYVGGLSYHLFLRRNKFQ